MSEELKDKEVEKKVAPKSKRKVGVAMRDVVSGEFLSQAGVVKNLPFLLFMTFLMVVYIAYGYHVDNTVRAVAKQERLEEELYSKEQSLMELYDRGSLPSKIADKINDELNETKDPPRIVWVKDGFYDRE